jgi:mRNA-degrading endonuclease RelE of RelBE toxin-antitoxin system
MQTPFIFGNQGEAGAKRLFAPPRLSGVRKGTAQIEGEAFATLRSHPYNRTRRHQIKKLENISPGKGQYRLRLGRWRFRYDIEGQDVVLYYCGLRREKTYWERRSKS